MAYTKLWLLTPLQAEKLLIPTEKKEDFEVYQLWHVTEWKNLKEKCKPLLLIQSKAGKFLQTFSAGWHHSLFDNLQLV